MNRHTIQDPNNEDLCISITLSPDGDIKQREWWKKDDLFITRHRLDGPAVITADGDEQWYKDGVRHRDNEPAIIKADGRKEWWLHGELHRLDGPAVISADGSNRWYQHGKPHRPDGPAFISKDGRKEEWYFNGEKHRVGGPAMIYLFGEVEEWWVNGIRHRPDGPAIKYSKRDTTWIVNGKLHRVDGPAKTFPGQQDWWVNGERHRVDGPAIKYSIYERVKSFLTGHFFLHNKYYLFGTNVPKEAHRRFHDMLEEELGKKSVNNVPYQVLKELHENTGTDYSLI